MTIEQLDTTKVLISLCNEDMRDFSLSFDTMSMHSDHSRKVLLRLLHLASSKTGIAWADGTVLVEALPHQSGCLILVTLVDKKKRRKTYKVKRIETRPCFCFDGIDSLFCAVESLRNLPHILQRNSLWQKDNKFLLVFDYPIIPARVRGILLQFSREKAISRVHLARIRESGKLICAPNAVEIISSKI